MHSERLLGNEAMGVMGNVVQGGGKHLTRMEVGLWEESCGKGTQREGVVFISNPGGQELAKEEHSGRAGHLGRTGAVSP